MGQLYLLSCHRNPSGKARNRHVAVNILVSQGLDGL